MNRFYYVEGGYAYLTSKLTFFFWILSMYPLPIVMVVFGALNLNNCPQNRIIPIWLIVGSGLIIFHNIFHLINNIIGINRRRIGLRNIIQIQSFPIRTLSLALIHIILLGWCVYGSIACFDFYLEINFNDTKSSIYCDQVTFWILYASTIIQFIYNGIAMTLLITGLVLGFIKPKI